MPLETYAISSKMELAVDDWKKSKQIIVEDAKQIAAEMDAAQQHAQSMGDSAAKAVTAMAKSMEAATKDAGGLGKETKEAMHQAAQSGDAASRALGEVVRRFVSYSSAAESASVAADLLAESEKRLNKSFADAERSADQAERSVRRLQESSDQAGSGSVESFGKFRRALGIVGQVGNYVEQFGRQVGQASIQMRTGEIDSAQMAGQMLRGIPILGDFTRGFDGLREAITGENAAIQLANEHFAETVRHTDAMLALLKTADEFKKRIDSANRPADLDQDVVGDFQAKVAKVNANREKAREPLLAELDRANKFGFGGRDKDAIRQDLERADEVARQEKMKLEELFRRGLVESDQRRFALTPQTSTSDYKPLNPSPGARPYQQTLADLERLSEQQRRRASRDASSLPTSLLGGAPLPAVNVTAPMPTAQEIAAAVKAQLTPLIDERIRQAQLGAQAVSNAARVAGGL